MPVKIRPKTTDNAYWREREIKQSRANKKNAQLYKKDVEKLYKKALYEITKEINACYNQYATEQGLSLADAKKRISKQDARQWQELNEAFKNSPKSKEAEQAFKLVDATARINRLELIKSKIGLKLIEQTDIIQQYFDGKLTYEAMQELERQAGVFGEFVGENIPQRAKRIAYASFHHATFSERIWNYQDELKNRLSTILTTALVIGRNPKHPQFVKDLQKAFGVTQHQAETLLVTEMARIQTDVQKFSFKRNGYDEYEFICCGGGAGTNKNDPCEFCKSLDGKVFKVKDMMPGENAAPIHCNCHCSSAPHYFGL